MVRVLIVLFRFEIRYQEITRELVFLSDVFSVKVIKHYNVHKQRNFVYRIFFYSYIFIKNNRNFLITKIKNIHTSSNSQ